MPVQWNSAAVMAKVRAAASRGVIGGAQEVREEAVRLITNTPKTGRIYRRRGVEHQASAPGQAPASDSGTLANWIDEGFDPATITATVTFRAEHARPMEFGTPTIEPRPFARPALANKRAAINARIAGEIRFALR